jgi:WD40-like Beta Propeller Repeat
MLGRQEILGHLTRLLESELLGASPSLAKLLLFCVNTALAGEEESLKETTIGVLCFGRTPGYDTKADPIVRVNARRLRTKLELFYEGEGRNDEIRISLPKGSYIPKFGRRAEEIVSSTVTVKPEAFAEPEIPVLPSAVAPTRTGRRYPSFIFAALLLFLFAAASIVFVRSRRGATTAVNESVHEPTLPLKNLFDAKAELSLSPDGERVAFSSDGNPSGVPRVYLQNRGSGLPTLLTQAHFPELHPVWSGDGKTITLLRQIEPTLYQLVQVDVATRSEDILRSIGLAAEGKRQARDDEWLSASVHDGDDLGRQPTKIAPLKLPKKIDSPSDNQKKATTPEDVSSNMLNAFEPRL